LKLPGIKTKVEQCDVRPYFEDVEETYIAWKLGKQISKLWQQVFEYAEQTWVQAIEDVLHRELSEMPVKKPKQKAKLKSEQAKQEPKMLREVLVQSRTFISFTASDDIEEAKQVAEKQTKMHRQCRYVVCKDSLYYISSTSNLMHLGDLPDEAIVATFEF